jgi:hypothetical protein
MPWDGTSVGDAVTSPYDAAVEWAELNNFLSGATGLTDRSGVVRGYQNELAVTGAVSPVSMNTGGAIVQGTKYKNDAAVSITVPTPAASTRIDRIILRKSVAAQTVRAVRLAGVEGGAAPALTQVGGTTWEASLYQVSITTGGVITLTDERVFCPSSAVQELFERTLAAAASEIDITGIPATFKHLRLYVAARSTGNIGITQDLKAQFNGDTGANYSGVQIYNDTNFASALATEQSGSTFAWLGRITETDALAGVFGMSVVEIPFYANTTFHKQWMAQNHAENANTSTDLISGMFSGRWRSTAAINRIRLFPESGNFDVGTSVTLVGTRD